MATVPRHVAIIMDGNGRWAKQRGLPRVAGHRAGAEAVRRALQAAADQGVEVLTLYAFSSENWRRSNEEISDLTGADALLPRARTHDLDKEGVRLQADRRHAAFGPDLVARLERAIERTAANDRLTLVIALNYGSRAEIAAAARTLATEAAAGEIDPEAIDEAALAASCKPRPAGARPTHSHLRRGAPVEFPAVAGGLCRADVRRHACGRTSTSKRSRRVGKSTPLANGGSAAR